MPGMSIATLAREGGVGVETVRFYQRRGLLPVPRRAGDAAGGGIRRYGEADRRRLRFIRAAQTAGFTLEQIGRLLALDAVEDRPRVHALAQEQLRVLDARIAELTRARDALARLTGRCGEGEAGPCPIIEAFDAPGPCHAAPQMPEPDPL